MRKVRVACGSEAPEVVTVGPAPDERTRALTQEATVSSATDPWGIRRRGGGDGSVRAVRPLMAGPLHDREADGDH